MNRHTPHMSRVAALCLWSCHARPGVQFDSAEKRASVALILRESNNVTEVFMIRRADKDGDPWSGHMAFPGGRVETLIASVESTTFRGVPEAVVSAW